MNEISARNLVPIWAEPEKSSEFREKSSETRRSEFRHRMQADDLARRYGLSLIVLFVWAASLILGCCVTGAVIQKRTEERVRTEMAIEYASMLEQYKAEQAEQVQASYFLSGDASREAFVNQEIDAAARLAAKMSNDTQKGGIICNALARVMSRNYPGTMQEVIAQPQQWMFYDEGNKFTAHDRELAETILRDYYENGIIPNGLTEEFVYATWSENDYVLRNTWDFGPSTRTWRYQG